MDLETFKRLSEQLASGKMSHIEFLEVLRVFGEAFQPDDEYTTREKKKMMAVLDQIIDKVKTRDQHEKNDLAGQIEEWLKDPKGIDRS